jgi:hypothetical protein
MSRTRILGGLVALACALPAGSAQAAPAGHHDVSATAVNHADSSRVDDFAWGISRQRGGVVVDQSNVARAYSSCTDCGRDGDRVPDRPGVGLADEGDPAQ